MSEVSGTVIDALSETDARRMTTEARNEFKSAVGHFERAWEIVNDAVRGGAHVALGYRSPGEYLGIEFAGVLDGFDVAQRRVAVRELTHLGLSTRDIAPVVGVSKSQVAGDRQVSSHWTPEPERVNPVTGEIVPAPTFRPVDVTGWTNDEIEEDLEACEAATARWEESTVPAKTTGHDGKTYTRPEPKETKETPVSTASRLAMPQPPKYGGNRLKHNQIIDNAVIAGKGMRIVLDEIAELDESITNEEAGRLASDLSEVIRSLKRVQTMLNRKATS